MNDLKFKRRHLGLIPALNSDAETSDLDTLSLFALCCVENSTITPNQLLST